MEPWSACPRFLANLLPVRPDYFFYWNNAHHGKYATGIETLYSMNDDSLYSLVAIYVQHWDAIFHSTFSGGSAMWAHLSWLACPVPSGMIAGVWCTLGQCPSTELVYTAAHCVSIVSWVLRSWHGAIVSYGPCTVFAPFLVALMSCRSETSITTHVGFTLGSPDWYNSSARHVTLVSLVHSIFTTIPRWPKWPPPGRLVGAVDGV